ncbi:MAG: hypothetical protein IBX39_00050 [Candidatus Methanoperedenaceae archaeon]|nr:hypothetical protein [Candidatus Methanoperedenaceae archaeon]
MFANIQIERSPFNIDYISGQHPSMQDHMRLVGARKMRLIGERSVYSPNHPINIKSEYTHINKPKKLDTFEDVFITKMRRSLNELYLNLDSIVDKQITLHQFKLDFSDYINKYWDLIQENDEKNNLVSLLETSIENLHVEDIQKPQIDVLEKILDVIKGGDISEDDTETIFYEIVNCGLDPMGSLDGISQLYED